MKEFKIGEKITLEVIKTDEKTCKGCFFDSKSPCEVWKKHPCSSTFRSDGKNIIFKEVKE
jgi:hypothetical protein